LAWARSAEQIAIPPASDDVTATSASATLSFDVKVSPLETNHRRHLHSMRAILLASGVTGLQAALSFLADFLEFVFDMAIKYRSARRLKPTNSKITARSFILPFRIYRDCAASAVYNNRASPALL